MEGVILDKIETIAKRASPSYGSIDVGTAILRRQFMEKIRGKINEDTTMEKIMGTKEEREDTIRSIVANVIKENTVKENVTEKIRAMTDKELNDNREFMHDFGKISTGDGGTFHLFEDTPGFESALKAEYKNVPGATTPKYVSMNSLRIDAINGKIEEVYNPSPIMGIREYGTIRRGRYEENAGSKKLVFMTKIEKRPNNVAENLIIRVANQQYNVMRMVFFIDYETKKGVSKEEMFIPYNVQKTKALKGRSTYFSFVRKIPDEPEGSIIIHALGFY